MVDQARFERAQSLWRHGAVSPDSEPGLFWVASETRAGVRYLVATPWAAGGMRCTCPDWQARRVACKHILAASLAEAERRIQATLAGGKSLRELKNEAIWAGLTGTETPGQDVVWTASYEILQALEDGGEL